MPTNGNHPPMESNELSPLLKSIFDDVSIRFNISSNGLTRNTQNGVDLFQHLRHIFENAQLRYPGFSKDFTQMMYEHLSKANTSDMNTTQITSGVVKLRI